MERKWSDLPFDMLTKIADNLGIISLACFRGVCKDWNSASSHASAHVELKNSPWFLLYGGEKTSECTLLSCDDQIFTLKIPEIENSTCLASYGGWLLFQRENTLFFFCPFSRSKFDLPSCPCSNAASELIATFSSPPTSPKCTVTIIRKLSDFELQLYLLHRGSSKWAEHKYKPHQAMLGRLGGTMFQEGTIHVWNDSGELVIYNEEKNEWQRFILRPSTSKNSENTLNYVPHWGRFEREDVKKKLKVKNDVSICICSAIVPRPGLSKDYDVLIHSGNIVEATHEGVIRRFKGTWIQPRYLQISPDYKWED